MSINFRIDGVPIKNPSDYKLETFNLTKSGRLSSGKMTMELVAKKRKFYFVYDAINHTDLESILALIDSNKMFMELEYLDNEVWKTATVYVGSIPRRLWRRASGGLGKWIWRDVTFDLIEQ